MILFAGDSFSWHDEEGSWTNILATNLNMPFTNLSCSGSSLWYTFEKLNDIKISQLIHSQKISYLIITCTNKDRVPFCEDPVKSHTKPLFVGNNILDDDNVNFVYYNKFYSISLHNFIYKEALSRLVAMYGKHTKIVLLSCFGDSVKFFNEIYSYNQDFLYCKTPLIKFSSVDTNSIKYKNHMTLENNKKVAESILNSLQTVKSGSFKL